MDILYDVKILDGFDNIFPVIRDIGYICNCNIVNWKHFENYVRIKICYSMIIFCN